MKHIYFQKMALTFSLTSVAMIATVASLLFTSNSVPVIVYKELDLPRGTDGPESLAYDRFGAGPYTGISNGAIVRYDPIFGFKDFAFTATNRNKTFCEDKNATADASIGARCGRPLGLAFNRTGFLYICDAYLGLNVVGPYGGQATQLLSSVGGIPIRFCNGLAIDSNNGIAYFTDFSSRYGLNNATLAMATKDRTGRLIRYDPATGKATVLASGLSGPGGVAVAADSSYVIFTELIGGTVKKCYLNNGTQDYTTQTLLNNVTGAGNVKRTPSGDFILPENVRPYVHRALRISGNGTIVANVSVEGPYKNVLRISEVQIVGFFTAIGSLFATFVGEAIGLKI